jgi:hypothetical protein
VFPGQLRPTFAQHDRTKRYGITAIAALLVVASFATLRTGGQIGFANSVFPIFFGALMVTLIVVQIVYHVRIAAVRRVAAHVAKKFPADSVLVGNVRFVGPSDSGHKAVPFATVILQFDEDRLSLWNPDSPERPYFAVLLAGLDVDVERSTPPRWRLSSPYSDSQTHLAIFTETGLSFERAPRMLELAAQLFPEFKAAPQAA